MDIDAMREHIDADSLSFLSIDGLYRAVNQPSGRDSNAPAYCDACFTGDYPTFLTDQSEEDQNSRQLDMMPPLSA